MIREVVPNALDTAVIRYHTATVAVEQSAHEILGGFLHDRLLPRFKSDAAMVLPAGPVLGEQARPVVRAQDDVDAVVFAG